MVRHADMPVLQRSAHAEQLPTVEDQATAVVCVILPLHIRSEANSRDHWRIKAKRVQLHRNCAELLLRNHPRPRTDGPIQITLTRIAPRRLDDDNLASGFKAARDGVADWLGIDDGAKRLEWRYAQRKGRPGQLGAEVVVMWHVEEFNNQG